MKNTGRKQTENMRTVLSYILGCFLFGAGISLCNKSMLGSNPMNVFVAGISELTLIEIGLVNFGIGLLEILFGYLFDRKDVSIYSLASLFATSFSISLVNRLKVPQTASMQLRLLIFAAGYVLYCLGLAIQQVNRCGYGNYDCFVFGILELFHLKKYHTARWIADIAFLLGAYLLGMRFRWGTFVILFLAGYLTEMFRELLSKLKTEE